MNFRYFSRNGEILPIERAVVPLSDIEYQYGFGVYETVRVTKRIPYFLREHLERLMESARIIGLEHSFDETFVGNAIAKLIEKNGADTCNVKILLVGGPSTSFGKARDTSLRAGKTTDASLSILCLNPLFPDKTLYRDGAHLITRAYERLFPHAKTLNMLGSYLAYRAAREAGAYDALLTDKSGSITEGTRTNFFCIRGKTVFTPPEKKILSGVMRKAVLKVADNEGFAVVEKDIAPEDLAGYEGAFVTSTSSKIMPARSIGTHTFASVPEDLRTLMRALDGFLERCGGVLSI